MVQVQPMYISVIHNVKDSWLPPTPPIILMKAFFFFVSWQDGLLWVLYVVGWIIGWLIDWTGDSLGEDDSPPPTFFFLNPFKRRAYLLFQLPGGNQNSRMQQAHVMHKRICTILLSAHESLQQMLVLYLSKLRGASFNLGVYMLLLCAAHLSCAAHSPLCLCLSLCA